MYNQEHIYSLLNKYKLQYEMETHEPALTVDDMISYGLADKGVLCKNLFLRDSKGKRFFLVSLEGTKQADLKELGKKLGAGNISFASEEKLMEILGVVQGGVAPFALVNDKNRKVEFFIDQELTKCDKLAIHPLINTETIFISYKNLEKFLWNEDIDVIKIRL